MVCVQMPFFLTQQFFWWKQSRHLFSDWSQTLVVVSFHQTLKHHRFANHHSPGFKGLFYEHSAKITGNQPRSLHRFKKKQHGPNGNSMLCWLLFGPKVSMEAWRLFSPERVKFHDVDDVLFREFESSKIGVSMILKVNLTLCRGRVVGCNLKIHPEGKGEAFTPPKTNMEPDNTPLEKEETSSETIKFWGSMFILGCGITSESSRYVKFQRDHVPKE